MLMLAILFGLSMDYEVFLLSRVREQWDLTGDNTKAVASGVQKTGRIITMQHSCWRSSSEHSEPSAIVFMKMIGIGMLVALLIDATIVRGLLVPATMKLLGDANWWAPGPMRRWWERHDIGENEAAAPPARQKESVAG
ncbi:MAG: MMPL family transporter [Nocardioidaceae bacterium]